MSKFKLLFVIMSLYVMSMPACIKGEGSAGAQRSQEKVVTGKPRLGPAIGGPYKVIAADFTGDGILDLALSYYPIDVVTIEQGDGHGQFNRLALNQIPYDDRPYVEEIYNIAHGDIDGEGLPDLAVGVGGYGKHGIASTFPGRAVVLRNVGQGRFERMAQHPRKASPRAFNWPIWTTTGGSIYSTRRGGLGMKATPRSVRYIFRKGLTTGNLVHLWSSKLAPQRTMSKQVI